MGVVRRVGEAVIWTVSSEDELYEALQAGAAFIELANNIQCRRYPLYLRNVKIFGRGLHFDIEAGQKPDNMLVLQGDVWLRNMSVNVSFKEGFFSDKDEMFAVVRVNDARASLGNVTIRLKAENLMGCKNSCYSGIYVLSPLELGGSVDVDVSGEYVSAISGSGIAKSRCCRDREWAGTTTLQIWQHNSRLPLVDGCFIDLDDVCMIIHDLWHFRKPRFSLKRLLSKFKRPF